MSWFISVWNFLMELIGSTSRTDVSWDTDQACFCSSSCSNNILTFSVSIGSVDDSCGYRSLWIHLLENTTCGDLNEKCPLSSGIWTLKAPRWLYCFRGAMNLLMGSLVGGSMPLGGDFECLLPCAISSSLPGLCVWIKMCSLLPVPITMPWKTLIFLKS